ncbi:MAG: hypothetical protein ACFFDK_05840 [Promethearchaeota archaeon]
MGIEDLSDLEIIEGILGLISLGITIFIGLKIISKFSIHKRIEFITVGLLMIFISSAWWGCILAFIVYIVLNSDIPDSLYIFLSYGLLPISVLLWLYSFGHLTYPNSKWKIVLIWVIISILYEIYFVILLFTNPTLLAIRTTRFDSQTQPYVSLYLILILIITIITNSIFFRKCLKSDDEKIQWMGKFIFLAIIIFLIGSILDSSITINAIMLFITRTLFLVSSILGYIGWIMPKRVASWLIKE